MLPAIVPVADIWTDTVGLAFTFFVLLPALVTGLIVVAVVTARGEKQADAKLRERWSRRPQPDDDE